MPKTARSGNVDREAKRRKTSHDDKWQCSDCTYENESEEYACEICGKKRPRTSRTKKMKTYNEEIPAKQHTTRSSMNKRNQAKKMPTNTRKAKKNDIFDSATPKRTYGSRSRKQEVDESSDEEEDEEEEEEQEEQAYGGRASDDEKAEMHEEMNLVQAGKEIEMIEEHILVEESNEEEEEEAVSEFEPALEKQANEEIRKIEQNYHTMSLKGINSLVIKTLLKSDDNYLKCFGTKLCGRSRILDTLVHKLVEKLTERPIQEQIKNVGVLHKLVKGLQRLLDSEVKINLSEVFREKLVEATEIEGLPVKTVKRCNDLLGAVSDADFVRPTRHEEELFVPVIKFPTVDWVATLLGPHGEKKDILEDEYDCRIRLIGSGSKNTDQTGRLRIKVSSLNRWNCDRCRDRVHKLLYDETHKHMTKQATTKKRWQQVLDKTTRAFYYWNMESNTTRWEAPPQGFVPHKELENSDEVPTAITQQQQQQQPPQATTSSSSQHQQHQSTASSSNNYYGSHSGGGSNSHHSSSRHHGHHHRHHR